MPRRTAAINLFCGGGGLTHGLERAGSDVHLRGESRTGPALCVSFMILLGRKSISKTALLRERSAAEGAPKRHLHADGQQTRRDHRSCAPRIGVFGGRIGVPAGGPGADCTLNWQNV